MTRGKHEGRFNRQFDRIERMVPAPAARFLAFLRRPMARLVRIPVGLLLMVGGVFSFLPVLGLWMLPLGLLLLAVDLPVLQAPMGQLVLRFRHFWARRVRRRGK